MRLLGCLPEIDLRDVFRLPSTDSVLCLLRWVEKHMAERSPRSSRQPTEGGHTPTSSQVHIPDNV